MLKIALTLTTILATQLLVSAASAAGAEKYLTIESMQKSTFYRVTCSSLDSAAQIHVNAVVDQGKIQDLKIVVLYPSESMKVISFAKKQSRAMAANLGAKMFTIDGSRPGEYYEETLSLEMIDGPQGLSGRFQYSDGEQLSLDRQVKCGVSNYILNPVN